jgi:nicotinamidase-related amidase
VNDPWLVAIDLQHVFADADSPWAAPRFAQILPVVQRLLSAFAPRATVTRFVAPARPQGAWGDYYRAWPFAQVPPDDRLYALVTELDTAGAQHLSAATFGKWTAPLAADVGAGPLVLCGVATDCCVISTALAAADAGVAVQVVSDACAGADDEAHERALALMASYAPLIEVVTAADVLRALGSRP